MNGNAYRSHEAVMRLKHSQIALWSARGALACLAQCFFYESDSHYEPGWGTARSITCSRMKGGAVLSSCCYGTTAYPFDLLQP